MERFKLKHTSRSGDYHTPIPVMELLVKQKYKCFGKERITYRVLTYVTFSYLSKKGLSKESEILAHLKEIFLEERAASKHMRILLKYPSE